MVITYLGAGAFKVQSGETSLLVDSDNNRLKADVSLKTLTPTASIDSGEHQPAQSEIYFAGEYEVKGIEIKGFAVPEESTEKVLKTAYLIEWEGMKLAFLGHVSKQPSPELIEKLNEPDILFMPVEGEHSLAPEAAAKVMRALEPAIVIPSFHKAPTEFLKSIGKKGDMEEKLVLKKKDLVNEKGRVVVLKPN